ncbi:hypothetical protein SD70_19960 [Gordoniibacillus kamchatkensis]|uniref:Uncharacterized protein n=1 Tax=Gordoniibacillus kamchatkensis TaxID=1590651 RepID=A0ABR5AEG6_9BACL|nr:hypothetical protein [Paenibacillus sp. VKM B-2647]KIL39450.1 hypothetical protein SD70_19960 [Paenibacillus sp. VKM B-2647]
MDWNLELSEEEMKALLAPSQNEPDAGGSGMPAELPGLAQPFALQQEAELLQAMANVVKTLTVRVASLEGEVGRLRAELAVACGNELPAAERRIVVEDARLPELPAEREVSAAADPQLGRRGVAAGLAAAPRGVGDLAGAETAGAETGVPAGAATVQSVGAEAAAS